MKKSFLRFLLGVVACGVQGREGAAQLGAGPVRATEVAATVQIVDGVATTRLRLELHNDGQREAEAVWILPLAEGAVADEFRMTVGGVETAGEVLAASEARGIYESIVRRRRDPGLLEFLGRGCLRARVYPVPPRGDVTVEVGFRHVLPERNGLHRWSFPAKAAGIEGRTAEQVTLDLALRSSTPIRNVYSPASEVHVLQKGDHEARASFEGRISELSSGELALFYGLSEEEFGLNLLSHRRSNDAAGTFLMMISPKREWDADRILKKSIVFVFDTSGSMAPWKIERAKAALRFFLGSLGSNDRFNVIPFSTEPEPFFPSAVAATRENVDEASARIASVKARGGTNIAQALVAGLESLEDEDDRVPLLVFLTDGHPTVGIEQPRLLLEEVRLANRNRTRIFVLGVGVDVNTHLLDGLAADGRGVHDYVRGEDIEERASSLFTKLSHPVMTDLALEVDGVRLERTVPSSLPDVFRGSSLTLLGRYRGEGVHAIRLAGTVDGERRTYTYEGSFARDGQDEHAFVPALWAARRVGSLLDAIRLNGADPELVDEVTRLGREYRIVTPYTSHLIVEEGLLASPSGPLAPGATGSDGFFVGRGETPTAGAHRPSFDEILARLTRAGILPKDAPREDLEELARDVVREMRAARDGLSRLGSRTTGAAAVDESTYLASLVQRSSTGNGADLFSLFSRRVRDKVFVLRDGVWVDRAYEPSLAPDRIVVRAFTDEYFGLLRERPELAPYASFSSRLIVVLGERVIEIEAWPG